MTKTVTITDRARLSEAANLEGYYRLRTEALMQNSIDQAAEITALKAAAEKAEEAHQAALEEQEAGFLARIAGLEDELRMARSASLAKEVLADGEQ